MKTNKLGLAKYLIILGAIFWSLPAFANELPGETPTSTPESEINSSTPEILPPNDTDTNTSTTSTPEIILSTTTIHLTVATSQETFSFPNLLVTACPETDISTVYTLNAMCAIKQSGLTTDWSTFGSDVFLNSINSYANDWAAGLFWNWFADLNYGQTALNKHILTTNENLLLTYDLLPLKITTDSTTPMVDSTSTITVEEFGFEGFNPIWKLATNSNLSINNNSVTNETGAYSFSITSTDPLVIFGSKPGFVPSSVITISPISVITSPTSTEPNTSTAPQPPTGGAGGGTNNQLVSQTTIDDTIEKLLNFIKSKQEPDGRIVDGGTSDWLAMSFGAKGIYAQTIKNGNTSLHDYIYNYPITELDNELNNCTAYPRHILALLSSGVPASDTNINALKNKLDSCVINTNFGANGINDDIFGLLAALAASYEQSSPVVQTTLATIQASQQPSGAFAYPGPFEGADLTGVAINALTYAQLKGLAVDSTIFTKAKAYLKTQQLTDGGWGYGTSDALTTGWVVMGINALGEGQNEWFSASGKNPWHILTTLDNDHFTQAWDGNIDWFSTKHAIPALLGRSWPIILAPTNNTQNTADSGSTGGSNSVASTSTENNSIIPPTSTPVTTTLATVPETPAEPESTILTGEILGEKITTQTTVRPTTVKKQTVITQNRPIPVPQTTVSEPTNTEPLVVTPTVASMVEDSSNHPIAKIILLVSGGGVLLLGLYLGLKSLKK